MAQSTILATTLSTPVNAAFSTDSTGGTLVPATYYYRVSAINAVGETLASTETSQVVGAGTNTNTVTVNWAAVSNATGYKVYGRSTGAELLIATVGAVLTYIDTGAVTPAGALPVANTTGGGAGVSSDVAVAAAAHVNVGIFTADAAGIPGSQHRKVYQDTPGNDLFIGSLSGQEPVMKLVGPGTFRVVRPVALGASDVVLGVFSET
ncbi:MAG: hypothetical protein A3E01_07000 [Gammaproteobacteria bacterium RIFCSPHIGHO2_12_FULL_63_22]|nr:MAG: hypothetical protein A3E01_07000 [Gammaproteobacteria bacterium RIFCSPHIGHO2_12_FULL_63_22]